MKLCEVRLRNFRCYRDEVSVRFEEMTALIGRNDAGKSTILEALDIFFNGGAPDRNDANKGGNRADVAIICVFSDLPPSIVLDEDVATNFQDEYLLNVQGHLEVHKIFGGEANPKLRSFHLVANHPTAVGAVGLMSLKTSDLRIRGREVGAGLSGVDQRVNAQLRRAIRTAVGNLALQHTEIPLLEGNAKKVGESIQAAFPAFALFKSDRPSTDQDPEAQDPLKAAVKEALKEKEAELNAIAAHIHQEVKKIADLTLAKLREMDPTLASSLSPQFEPPKWASLFKATITGDDDIPINKRGSGVRRLILLNFFRAKAEQLMRDSQRANVIYAVEEPETSQHPRNQRLLISALQLLSGRDQVIVTTHTPTLARVVPARALRYIHSNAGRPEVLEGGADDTNKLIVESLGVLPDHNVRLFIGVEGKYDIPFLRAMSSMLRSAGEDVPDLEKLELEGEVIFLPLGGSGLAEWTHRLVGLNRPEFHLYDRDTSPPTLPKYQRYVDEVNARPGCYAVSTVKREAENYIHQDAMNAGLAELGLAVRVTGAYADFDDVPTAIKNLINAAAPPSDQWGNSRAKEFLCTLAATKMTRAMLDHLDPNGEVVGWFRTIKTMHQGANS